MIIQYFGIFFKCFSCIFSMAGVEIIFVFLSILHIFCKSKQKDRKPSTCLRSLYIIHRTGGEDTAHP